MLNNSLKEDALKNHQKAVDQYNKAYEDMRAACNSLYCTRNRAIREIEDIEMLVSSIANKPKEFDSQLGQIRLNVKTFGETKRYAEETYNAEVKSGKGILAGMAAGGAVMTAAPSVAMSIATTFGTASTGKAISSLSGAAAEKAALAWLGRKTGGIATQGIVAGAGMTSGQAFLALAGPIGVGVSAISTVISMASLSSQNRNIANEVHEETKVIMEAEATMRRTTARIIELQTRTARHLKELSVQVARAKVYRFVNYLVLDEETQFFLGNMVNNTQTLTALLNKTVE